MFGRQRIAALVAEFLGTGALTLVIISVQRSTIGVPFFVALGAGLTVALMTFLFGHVSGAHLNPALTIGMWTARKITTGKAIFYVGFQLLGAYAAYLLYTYFVDNKLSNIGGHYSSRVLTAEAVGALVLGFAAAAAVYQRFSNATTAAINGLGYMLAIVAASSVSLGIINPAVAFGAQAWVWGTYVLGPILGAVIAINVYGLLFADRDVVIAGETAALASVSISETTIVEAPAKPTRSTRSTAARKPRAAAGTRSRSTTTRVAAKPASRSRSTTARKSSTTTRRRKSS
ncbi:MAG: major intrinsic protein [Candidatus Saccharibacteria bacterium]|nr:major intrinsic protein [Candidatus Saccharibacteria bacterium]